MTMHITPNIRDREKRFIGYKYYDQSTLAAYQRIQSEAIPSLGSIKQNRLAEKSNFWVLRTTLCISN